MTKDAASEPLDVQVVNGDVVMTGPRVAIAITPPAANETARRLVEAAEQAAAEVRPTQDAIGRPELGPT